LLIITLQKPAWECQLYRKKSEHEGTNEAIKTLALIQHQMRHKEDYRLFSDTASGVVYEEKCGKKHQGSGCSCDVEVREGETL
jgi:hypothetical protein